MNVQIKPHCVCPLEYNKLVQRISRKSYQDLFWKISEKVNIFFDWYLSEKEFHWKTLQKIIDNFDRKTFNINTYYKNKIKKPHKNITLHG